MRVLVVDDNRDAADTLVMLIHLWGHQGLAAYSGLAGLAAAQEFQPHVVLADLRMPGVDGFEFARLLRSQRGPAPLALWALTASDNSDNRNIAGAVGFTGFLVKPGNPDELQAKLEQLKRELI